MLFRTQNCGETDCVAFKIFTVERIGFSSLIDRFREIAGVSDRLGLKPGIVVLRSIQKRKGLILAESQLLSFVSFEHSYSLFAFYFDGSLRLRISFSLIQS